MLPRGHGVERGVARVCLEGGLHVFQLVGELCLLKEHLRVAREKCLGLGDGDVRCNGCLEI